MRLADLMKKGSLRQFATVTVATVATVKPDSPPSVATVASVSVATAQKRAANDPAADPDRWAWPHSAAMTGTEIDTFTARLVRFTNKGVGLDDAEALADKLVTRDRESDDRRVCLECSHLTGHGAGSWRCGNWQAAAVSIHSGNPGLAAEYVLKLQRCDGFAAHILSTSRPTKV